MGPHNYLSNFRTLMIFEKSSARNTDSVTLSEKSPDRNTTRMGKPFQGIFMYTHRLADE